MLTPAQQKQVLFWTFMALLVTLFIWLFKPVLFPFVLGWIVAYLLNPVVNDLERKGMNRLWGTLLVLSSFMVFALALVSIAVPVLYKEMNALAQGFPGYVDKAWNMLAPHIQNIKEQVTDADQGEIKEFIQENGQSAADIGKGLLIGLAAGGAVLNRLISIFVIAPVVAFFALKEWPETARWIEELMPRQYKKTINDLLEQMNKKLSGFIRGQLLVAFILGVSYAIILSILGLKYGLLIGFIAGLLNIIPLLGSTAGLVIGVTVAGFQTGWEWQYMLIIAGIFMAGQLIEGNFLTPKLLGNSVGMHPLWIFFALLAGGAVAGILGMLLAVPVAAVIGVLAAFGIRQYKNSSLYKGARKQAGKDETSS